MNQSYKKNDISVILSMDPLDFVEWLESQFGIDTAPHMENIDDINRGLDVMSVQASALTYLYQLLSYAKIYTRNYKRMGKEYKNEAEDMIDRKEAIENLIDSIKLSHQTINKSITIYTELSKTQPEYFRKG